MKCVISSILVYNSENCHLRDCCISFAKLNSCHKWGQNLMNMKRGANSYSGIEPVEFLDKSQSKKGLEAVVCTRLFRKSFAQSGLKTLGGTLLLNKAFNSQLCLHSSTRSSILSETSISNHAFYHYESSFNPHKSVPSKEGQHFVLCWPNYSLFNLFPILWYLFCNSLNSWNIPIRFQSAGNLLWKERMWRKVKTKKVLEKNTEKTPTDLERYGNANASIAIVFTKFLPAFYNYRHRAKDVLWTCKRPFCPNGVNVGRFTSLSLRGSPQPSWNVQVNYDFRWILHFQVPFCLQEI